MKKFSMIIAFCILLCGVAPVKSAQAAVFMAMKSGVCFEVIQKSVISRVNPYFVINRCESCKCTSKSQEAIGFETMSDAMQYLEDKYGPLKPQESE